MGDDSTAAAFDPTSLEAQSPNPIGPEPFDIPRATGPSDTEQRGELAQPKKIDANSGAHSRFSGLKKLPMMAPPGLKHYDTGDVAGLDGPELGVVGENGPEAVVPVAGTAADPGSPTEPVEVPTVAPPLNAPVPTSPPAGGAAPSQIPDSQALAAPQPTPAESSTGLTDAQALAVPSKTNPSDEYDTRLSDIDTKEQGVRAKMTPAPNNWAQRLGLAILSMTKFGPIANQLIHPKWSEQQRGYGQQLANLEGERQDVTSNLQAEALAESREAQAAYKNAQAARQAQIDEERQQTLKITQDNQKEKVREAFVKSLGPGAIPLTAQDTAPAGYHVVADPTNPNLQWVSRNAFIPLPPEMLPVFPGKKAGDQVTAQEYDAGMNAMRAQQLETIKQAKPGAGDAKKAFQDTLTKLAMEENLPAGAMSDVPKLVAALDSSRTLTPEEKAAAKGYLASNTTPEGTAEAGILRMLAMEQTRGVPVVDTADGSLKVVNMADINANPGRYAPAAQGATSMGKEAVFQDLHYNIDTARKAIQALDSMDPGTRATLSYALRHTDPKSAFQTFLTGTVGQAMNPQQQEAAQALALLSENALALRSVAGMGQGSDDLRSAIQATIPSGKSPTKGYALDQLNKFENVVKRLESGVPGVRRSAPAPTQNPDPNRYIVGHIYGNQKYLGPDPMKPTSWQPAKVQ